MGEEKLYVSWKEFDSYCVNLSNKLRDWAPNAIMAVARGGLMVGVRLSHLLEDVKIGYVEVKYYIDSETRKPRPAMVLPPTMNVSSMKVVVVDDVVDTGDTLKLVIENLMLQNPSEIKTATLTYKKWSKVKPDYYSFGPVDKWVVFPWEVKP